MIVVDASALVAIIKREPERDLFIDCMTDHDSVIAGTATIVEARLVLHFRLGAPAVTELDLLLESLGVDIVPVTAADLPIIHDAFLRFGKGSGSAARLNMRDLFSYALAKGRGVPLLFKGDDFGHTDLRPALPAPG